MREIKFRAWWKHPEYCVNGMMCRVGGLIHGKPEEGEPEYWFDNTTPVSVGLIGMNNPSHKIGWNDAEFCTLMQYTGLTDKNGKEIYEGDVVLSPHGNKKPLVIEWGEYSEDGEHPFHFGWLLGDTLLGSDVNGNYNFVEVIGNIYENPELLT